MVIVAKFESTCTQCNLRITVGTQVNWSKGVKASHVTCPQPSGDNLDERAESVVKAAVGTENLTGSTYLLTAIVNGNAEGNAVLAQAALDIIEGKLTAEYETMRQADQLRQVIQETPPEMRWDVVPVATASIPKGIYRVSLTGSERRYGVDHVNIKVTPNEKYQNVKIGEWHGESLGTYSAARGFRYWPSVDPTGARTLAIRAAFDILAGSADPVEFAKAYAVESSSCYRCGADLVDDVSRARLLGPECFKLAN